MINGILVVSSSGTPLLFFNPQDQGKDTTEFETLFSGVLTAIDRVLEETKVGKVSSFQTDKNTVYTFHYDSYSIVIITELQENEDLMNLVSLIEPVIDDRIKRRQSSEIIDDINSILNKKYEEWKEKNKESKALKKMKEALW